MNIKKKEIIFLAIWLLGMMLTLQFFRFKFGLFPIVIVFGVLGFFLQWLLFRKRPN